MDNNEILNAISELKTLVNSRRGKYYRNYRRYNYTPYMSLEEIRSPTVAGYYQTDLGVDEDVTPTPQLNVIKSCIDTLVSKIAQSKVRPYFNCINGDYDDIQNVKSAQHYFDTYFDNQNVHQTVSLAFRDACIFDTGWIFVNRHNKSIERALPWQVYFRPAELTYGHLTRIYYERADYPVTLLDDKLKSKINPNQQYVKFGSYYDIVNHVDAHYLPDYGELQVETFGATVTPFIPLFYSHPVNGSTSLSIVDILNSIQLEIDGIMAKISEASQLNPAMTAFVPADSNIKTSSLNNRIGNVVMYKATPNMTSSPVTIMTPSFIDQQYMQLLNDLIQRAYELVGISELSAMSRKPQGLNSGIALSTMEDVESDRFETQLNQVIRAYVNIAKTAINVFNPTENILPPNEFREDVKWSDIVKMENQMTIQFSGADQLSKDPSTKLQQLTQLAAYGIIPQTRIAQYMQIPDVEGGYSLAQNAVNACQSVIRNCIKNDVYDIPEFVPFSLLKEEIINTQLLLTGANINGKNDEQIEKLTTLFRTIINVENELQQSADNTGTQEMSTQSETDYAANINMENQLQ